MTAPLSGSSASRPRLLASYRFRRRALRVAIALAVTAVIVGIAFAVGDTAPSWETSRSNQPAAVFENPDPVSVTPELRSAAGSVVRQFVSSAVVRERPDLSWRLASPALRAASTKADWERGDMPVAPYPADVSRTDFRVVEAYEDEILLDVFLFPRNGAGVGAQVVSAELRRFGRGEERRWLVASWAFRTGIYSAEPAPSERKRPERSASRPPPRADEGRIGAVWLLVPAAIFALAVAAIGGFVIFEWRRGARARRVYNSSSKPS